MKSIPSTRFTHRPNLWLTAGPRLQRTAAKSPTRLSVQLRLDATVAHHQRSLLFQGADG
ncbi:MAG: hypothetical protein QNL51_11635 [Opitutaceae bacterium]